jgi:hypothetical protein
MSYFDKFPLYYTRTSSGTNIVMTDLFRRVHVAKLFGDVSVALVPYLILDGETPEHVSHRFYGSPFYHWVVLLTNNIVNVYTEWPLSQNALNQKILGEYENPYDAHHYVSLSSGFIVDQDDDNVDVVPVTNIDHENAENDAKRTIRVLDPDYLSGFVQRFTDLIGE